MGFIIHYDGHGEMNDVFPPVKLYDKHNNLIGEVCSIASDELKITDLFLVKCKMYLEPVFKNNKLIGFKVKEGDNSAV